MTVVQLSYLKLLEEISRRLGIEIPQCKLSSVGEGWFVACIEFDVVRIGSIVESIRCWGGPSPDIQEVKEEAAISTIGRMKCEFGLKVKDVNYDDYMLYRNMYDHVTAQYATLLANYNNLEREYKVLKDRFDSTLSHNAKLVVEQARMRSTIDDNHATINRLRRGCSVSTAEPSEDSSRS